MGMFFVSHHACAMGNPFDNAQTAVWGVRDFTVEHDAEQPCIHGPAEQESLAASSLVASKCLLVGLPRAELVGKVVCFLISLMKPTGQLIVNERTASFCLEPRNMRLDNVVESILDKSEISPIAVVYACLNLKNILGSGVCKMTTLNVRRLFLSSCMIIDRRFRRGYDWKSIAAFFGYNPGLVSKMELDMCGLMHDHMLRVESESLFFLHFLNEVPSVIDFNKLRVLGDL